ncbi:hypothetical protein PO909_003153 [Leuciscus waleckii]
MERLCAYLHHHASRIGSIELGFTELTDEAFLLLLPTLASLPRLETLALNGNRLTRAVLKELTDTLKDPDRFPSVTWIDLGNNVDIFSLPQPFLVSLRKRCPKKGNLPTILEFGESQASEPEGREGEEYFQSQSSHLSCSSQSQHSSGAIEPLREDSVPDRLACHSDNPT